MRAEERGGLVGWVVVVGVALAWGTLTVRHADVGLHAAPFKGHWHGHGSWRLLPATALGGAVAVWGPRAARWLRWPWVPVAAGLAAAAWTVALAASDGWDRLTGPLTTRHEYEPFAAGVGDLGGFLRTYVDRLGNAPIHVQGHPPGPVVLAWALDRLGLGGAGWLAAVAIAAWGVAVAAALVTARLVAGEAAARRAAPALAVLPAAIWAGTSLDPLFAALTTTATALATLAAASPRPLALAAGSEASASIASGDLCTGHLALTGNPVRRTGFVDHTAGGPPRRAGATALGAGGVLGLGLLSTYGAVAVVPVLVVAVVLAGREAGMRAVASTLVLVGVGALGLLVLAGRAGFWWPDGLAATRAAYWDGIGSHRPALYLTLFGNPAALAMAVGPATALGLGHLARDATAAITNPGNAPGPPSVGGGAGQDAALLAAGGTVAIAVRRGPAAGHWRRPGLAVLVVVALGAVLVADLSQLARGEVERIWLPFVPWLALAAPGDRRGWLAVQVAVALVLQAFLVSPW